MYCVIPLAAQSLAQTVDRIALAGPRKFEGPLHRRQILCHDPFYAQNRRATIRGTLPGLPRFRLTSCQHSRAIPGRYRPVDDGGRQGGSISMRKIYLLALVAAGTAATPVVAQSSDGRTYDGRAYDRFDRDSRGNPASQVSGLRVEPRIGYERVISELNVDTADDSASVRVGKSGVTYGGEVGYDAQVNVSAVLGVYAGLEGSSAKECENDIVSVGDRTCIAANRNITVGARGGYLLSPTTLLYVKGGFSSGRLRLSNRNATVEENNVAGSDSLSGFHAGAGIQTAFSSRFYGKLEYVYTDYNGYEVNDGTTKTSLDFSRHQAIAGFGVRF